MMTAPMKPFIILIAFFLFDPVKCYFPFVDKSFSNIGSRSRPIGEKIMYMGLDVKIRTVGRKNGCERWLSDAYDMYETRLRSSNVYVETIWHKNNEELVKAVRSDSVKDHSVVLLDVKGDQLTSEEFSKSFYQWLNTGGSRVAFVIGGAEGLPTELKQEFCSNVISLSSMTFTHQFARTMLVEQIYRASEIEKGSNYHK